MNATPLDHPMAEIAASQMDGKTLGEAFRDLVFGCPEVTRLGKLAIEENSSVKHMFEHGAFSPFDSLWPVSYEFEGFVYAATDIGVSIAGDLTAHHGPQVLTAIKAIETRFTQFIALLRNGDVLAIGDPFDGGPPRPVRRSYWDGADIWIDVETSNLVRKAGTPPQIVFEKLEFQVSENLISSQKNRGGRDPKYPWGSAFDELVIKVGTEGIAENGAALARMYLGCLETVGVAELPSEAQVRERLKSKHPRLWQHVVKGG